MIQRLRDIQVNAGAILTTDTLIPISFNNDREAIEAARSGVALYDRSHWGLIKISGDDRLRYLHNQSTNDFNLLKPSQGCDTVFVTPTARTIDLATAYVTDEAVLILASPHRRQQLISWLDRFIFPMDRVELADVSSEYAIFNLLGSQSDRLLQKLGWEDMTDRSLYEHQLFQLEDIPIRIAVGSGLAMSGYTLILPMDKATEIWQKLTTSGAIPLGDRVWEQLRIEQGRPIPDRELTEDYNPLEAGLWHTISFNKGCYIGQETIARLNTYKGVKQRLWGIKLTASATANTPVTVGEEKIGLLTSYIDTNNGFLGLAYIRTKAGGVGLNVKVGEVSGEIISLPFITHEYPN